MGLARIHLQQLLTATAMNVVRVVAWGWDGPLGEHRREPGHLAQQSAHPLSRQRYSVRSIKPDLGYNAEKFPYR